MTTHTGAGQSDTTTFSYDPDGNILTASDDGGAIDYTFSYDAAGNLISQQGPWGLSLNFSYDGNGNRTGTTDSLGGTTTSTYDGNGDLKSLQFEDGTNNLGASWTYDYNGNPLTVTRKDHGQAAGSSQYTYNGDGNVTQITHFSPGGTTLAAFSYQYDSADRLTSETDNDTTTTYSYDSEGQLTSAGSHSYSYDPNGNPTNGTTVGTDNEVTSDGDWSYTYDAAGNRITASNSTTRDAWTYGYNAHNQMTSAVEKDDSGSLLENASYVYDPFGNRVEESVTNGSGNTTVTRYAYDALGQTLWATFDGSGNLQTRYINATGLEQVVAQITASGTAWLYTDHLGSTRVVADSQGTVLDQLSYSSFGTVTDANPSYGELFQFTGWQYDVVTGYYRADERWYDPMTQTWTTVDPDSFAAGQSNLHEYVGNGPTDGVDPTGLERGPVMMGRASGSPVINPGYSGNPNGQPVVGKAGPPPPPPRPMSPGLKKVFRFAVDVVFIEIFHQRMIITPVPGGGGFAGRTTPQMLPKPTPTTPPPSVLAPNGKPINAPATPGPAILGPNGKPINAPAMPGPAILGPNGKPVGVHEPIGGAATTFGKLQAEGFTAPRISANRYDQLTNGIYTLDEVGMQPHLTGSLAASKSQFMNRVNASELTLDAAAYADQAGLWVGNKAKVIFDRPIGVHAVTGEPTNVLNIYRTRTGFIHAAPGTP